MPTKDTNDATRREWRELGFFYERDDQRKEWRIRGSRFGLLAFAHLLLDYSKNPRRQQLSDHDHFGPYMYLEIGTWNARVVDDHWIAGTPEDLSALSTLVREAVLGAKPGDVFQLRCAYAPASLYELQLEVYGDEFDPAAADTACW